MWIIIITSIATMLVVRHPKRLPWYILPVSDAIGLAAFVGIGVEKALAFQDSYLVAVLMGVLKYAIRSDRPE